MVLIKSWCILRNRRDWYTMLLKFPLPRLLSVKISPNLICTMVIIKHYGWILDLITQHKLLQCYVLCDKLFFSSQFPLARSSTNFTFEVMELKCWSNTEFCYPTVGAVTIWFIFVTDICNYVSNANICTVLHIHNR